MSLAVGIKDNLDPTVLSSSSSTGSGNSAQDLQNQFLNMLVTQLKIRTRLTRWTTVS